jgi:phage terminase Nu1 subunit (DNA packaging protein)
MSHPHPPLNNFLPFEQASGSADTGEQLDGFSQTQSPFPSPSQTMKTPPSNRRESGSVIKLAKSLGFTPRHTQTLLKQGMGDTLAEARQWLSERENSDTAAALRKERTKLVKAQRIAVETANAKSKAELISRAEVQQHLVHCGSALQAMLRRLERELPQLALGLTISQSAPLVKSRIREIQQSFSDMSDEFWQPTTNNK